MFDRRHLLGLAALLVLFGLAGCSSDSGPSVPVTDEEAAALQVGSPSSRERGSTGMGASPRASATAARNSGRYRSPTASKAWSSKLMFIVSSICAGSAVARSLSKIVSRVLASL